MKALIILVILLTAGMAWAFSWEGERRKIVSPVCNATVPNFFPRPPSNSCFNKLPSFSLPWVCVCCFGFRGWNQSLIIRYFSPYISFYIFTSTPTGCRHRLEEEEYLELIELFIETGMSDLEKLQSAIEEGNAEKVASAAHSLKGAASNLGLVELSETAKEIEEHARNDRLEEIAEYTQTLKKKLDEIAELVIFTARSA